MRSHDECVYSTADPNDYQHNQDYASYLTYSYVTMGDEPGRALVDTAAQHGLNGKQTVERLDAHLQTKHGLRVQHTNEDVAQSAGYVGKKKGLQSLMCLLASVDVVDPDHVTALLCKWSDRCVLSVWAVRGKTLYVLSC